MKQSAFLNTRLWPYDLALAFTVFFWGSSSVMYTYFYNYYSAAVLTALLTFVSALFFIGWAGKRLLTVKKSVIRLIVPICILNSSACILQRIGLQYTTPAHFAFLEHLSCVVVPIAIFALVRRRPTIYQVIAGALCLSGCFILSGMAHSEPLGLGDALCILSGVLFGMCTALIGTYAKDVDIRIFMAIYTLSYFLVSLLLAIALNFITINGAPMEKILFSWDVKILVPVIIMGFVDIAICWMLRTAAVQHLDPTTVAVTMPFSAVVASVGSVLCGFDTVTPSLVIGGIMILAAALLPNLADILRRKK